MALARHPITASVQAKDLNSPDRARFDVCIYVTSEEHNAATEWNRFPKCIDLYVYITRRAPRCGLNGKRRCNTVSNNW